MDDVTIDEFKIRNKVFEYGLTDEQIKILEDAYAKSINGGIVCLFRNGDYVYGVDYNKNYWRSDKKNVIYRQEGKMHKFPTVIFKGLDIRFELSEQEIEYLVSIKDSTRRDFDFRGNTRPFDDVKSLKAFLRDFILLNADNNRYEFGEELLKPLFWIFDDECKDESIKAEPKEGFSLIWKVWTVKNSRFYLSVIGKGQFKDKYFLSKIDHDADAYNYIDEGRVFTGNKFIWNDLDINDVDIKFIDKMGISSQFMIINKEEYEKAVRKYQFKIKKEKEDEEFQVKMKSEIRKRIDDISEENPIILGGIRFTDEGIYYQNQKISGKIGDRVYENGYYRSNDYEHFVDFAVSQINQYEGKNPDFNVLFENFCNAIEGCEFNGVLGNVDIKVERKKNDTGLFYYINDIRINKIDVVPLLKRAICFNTAEEYADLLKKVSHCNLTFHDIISNGLIIKFSDGESRDDGFLKLCIRRNKNKNYIVLDDKEFQISNTNKLISLSYSAINDHTWNRRNTPKFGELVTVFKKMFEFTDDEIVQIFADGLKIYKEAIRNSEQFLKEAIEVCKVNEITEGEYTGYLITGNSGRRYLLTDELKIYGYPEMQYICVVDKTLGKGFANDKIASRIYALKNDSFLVSQISTLKR